VRGFRHPSNIALVMLTALAIALAIGVPNRARRGGSDDVGGGQRDGAVGYGGMEVHPFDDHHAGGGSSSWFGSGPLFPYYGSYPSYGYYPYYGSYPSASGDGAPSFWYYCASSTAYYPSVTSCPGDWVPVPAF
jgi:hypothetical protein